MTCWEFSVVCLNWSRKFQRRPQERAKRIGWVGGPFASAIVCLCSDGLSEHPWDSQTTLLTLFQNKGRILERYTEFRGYLCGRFDRLLFLGSPGRISGKCVELAVCRGPRQRQEALLWGVLIFQIRVYQTQCPRLISMPAKTVDVPGPIGTRKSLGERVETSPQHLWQTDWDDHFWSINLSLSPERLCMEHHTTIYHTTIT